SKTLQMQGEGLGRLLPNKGVMLYDKVNDFQYIGVRDKFFKEYFYIRMLQSGNIKTEPMNCGQVRETTELRIVRVSLDEQDWQLCAPLQTALSLVNFGTITDGRIYSRPNNQNQFIKINNIIADTNQLFTEEIPKIKKRSDRLGLCAIDFSLSYIVDYTKFQDLLPTPKTPVVVAPIPSETVIIDGNDYAIVDEDGFMPT
ncbi:MAG: hypothetical protein ACPGXZ_00690, partial [Saprospiraceae bacterium]